MGGRKKNRVENKHPYMIHANHSLTAIIVRDAHSYEHLGVEWVLNIMRKHCWVVKGRPLFKRMITSCITCIPNHVFRSWLSCRIINSTWKKYPFTVVGVGIFGLYSVKYGRSDIKRYGCLYTCFGCRKVHVEKLDTMDIDIGFRRFIARRGRPETVHSDLGTNLVGGHS